MLKMPISISGTNTFISQLYGVRLGELFCALYYKVACCELKGLNITRTRPVALPKVYHLNHFGPPVSHSTQSPSFFT